MQSPNSKNKMHISVCMSPLLAGMLRVNQPQLAPHTSEKRTLQVEFLVWLFDQLSSWCHIHASTSLFLSELRPVTPLREPNGKLKVETQFLFTIQLQLGCEAWLIQPQCLRGWQWVRTSLEEAAPSSTSPHMPWSWTKSSLATWNPPHLQKWS